MLDLVKQFGDNTMTKKRDDFTMQTDKGYDFFEASSAFQNVFVETLRMMPYIGQLNLLTLTTIIIYGNVY